MTKEQTETKREARRLQAERRQDSMTLILDHAEAEFAAKGYNGVTISSVAASAGVDTSLMRYYFGDKEKLYWSYHFLTGSFTFSLGRTGRIDRLSSGLVHSDNFLGIADRLPVFVAAGIRALCAPDGPPDLNSPSDEDRSPRGDCTKVNFTYARDERMQYDLG